MINHPHRSKRAISSGAAPKRKPVVRRDHDAEWATLIDVVRNGVLEPLFTTDADPDALYTAYLSSLGRERQVHDCHACRSFIKRYGGLVAVTAQGVALSAFWNEDRVPEFYADGIREMRRLAERAKVTGPFLSATHDLGASITDGWTHLAAKVSTIHRHPLLTAGQAMAAKRADFDTVDRALADFKPGTIAEAIRLLEAEQLPRSERFLAPLHWLANLHDMRSSAGSVRGRKNVLWHAIASAPEGFCHPRSAVTGTLLEDIAAGISFQEVKRRFGEKLHPLRYQRPQETPKAGTIANAEAVFAKMGLALSLERRFARLDEIQTAWAPFTPRLRPTAGGVFSHLAPKGSPRPLRRSANPDVTMTWEKFARVVLPAAEAIEVMVDPTPMAFVALTTAQHDDAPPILKWDNPFAWYLYHNGSHASRWGLTAGWTKVSAIAPLPPMWGSTPMPHLGEGFLLLLEGARDETRGQGNGLFPECLRGELHGVRSVIEAYSRSAVLRHNNGAPEACGLDVRKGATNIGYRLRVTVDGLQTGYKLDRWD